MEQVLQGLEFAFTLLSAEYLFIRTFEKRAFWGIKAVSGAILLGICFILMPAAPGLTEQVLFGILIYLILFFLSVVYFGLLYRGPFWEIVFCCIAGYSVQHCWFNIHMMWERLYSKPGINALSVHYTVTAGISYMLIYVGAYLFFARKVKGGNCGNISSRSLAMLSGVILFITVVFNILFGGRNTDSYLAVLFNIYASLCCVITLVIQFNILEKTRLRYELETAKQLLKKECRQYEVSKENMELLNTLCHDLKYQFHEKDQKMSVPKAYLDRIYTAVELYDASVKTGNAALDVILTEHMLWCRKNGVILTCMADGSSLSFMEEVDIYSLFGNLVSNAEESVQKLEDEEKRFIGVTVKRIRQMLSIQVENYFEGQLIFHEGLPVTTKEKAEVHGFGMKSMQLIVEKYHGNMSVDIHDEIFAINILLKIPENFAG